jgi:hypothetical protein
MRTKLRFKTGDIDPGRKRSKVELCQSSGRKCKRDEHSNLRSETSRRDVQCTWLHGNGSAALRSTHSRGNR